MHKKLVVCILVGVIGVVHLAFASAPVTLWTKTYGGTNYDLGYSVQQTQDGGFIIAGNTESFGAGGSNAYLIKTNSSGDTLWTKTYGGTGNDYAYSVQCVDSGFVIAGGTVNKVYLIRTNSSGDTLWTKIYGGTACDWGYSVQSIPGGTGGFIIAGYSESTTVADPDIYLVRTDSLGDTLWTRTFGGTSYDYGYSVQSVSGGTDGFIIAGATTSFGVGSYDIYLIRTNSSGDTLWTKTYGGISDDRAYSIQQTSDSGFIIVGWTHSFETGYDTYLIKINSSGDALWTKTYGGVGDDYCCSVQQTQDSGFILAGTTYSFGAGSKDVYLIRINSSGDTLWTKTVGGTKWDEARSVQQTSDGGFIVAGSTGSFGAGYDDVYLIRLDKEFGVEEKSNIKNQKLNIEIGQNPFISSTVISYIVGGVSQPRYVSLNIYDIAGTCVKTLINESKPAGTYTTTLTANDLKTGVYFLTLSAGTSKVTKKLTIIR
ncbi:MAG: T9SS type A sorting domain-containing protein [bacterium]|nr:T9SS type A sorting domain-containing protein [bacterium]